MIRSGLSPEFAVNRFSFLMQQVWHSRWRHLLLHHSPLVCSRPPAVLTLSIETLTLEVCLVTFSTSRESQEIMWSSVHVWKQLRRRPWWGCPQVVCCGVSPSSVWSPPTGRQQLPSGDSLTQWKQQIPLLSPWTAEWCRPPDGCDVWAWAQDAPVYARVPVLLAAAQYIRQSHYSPTLCLTDTVVAHVLFTSSYNFCSPGFSCVFATCSLDARFPTLTGGLRSCSFLWDDH